MEHQVWITFMIMVILVRHMSSAAESSTQTWATMNGPAWVDGTEFLGRYTISGETESVSCESGSTFTSIEGADLGTCCPDTTDEECQFASACVDNTLYLNIFTSDCGPDSCSTVIISDFQTSTARAVKEIFCAASSLPYSTLYRGPNIPTSTSSDPTDTRSSDPDDSSGAPDQEPAGLSTGAIIGLGVGVGVGFVVLLIIGIICWCRRQAKSREKANNPSRASTTGDFTYAPTVADSSTHGNLQTRRDKGVREWLRGVWTE